MGTCYPQIIHPNHHLTLFALACTPTPQPPSALISNAVIDSKFLFIHMVQTSSTLTLATSSS